MQKDLIIIALIIVVIYLADQQLENNQSPHIIESPNNQQLRSELNHYQTLYQQRIEKDVGDAEKVVELEEQLTLVYQDLKTISETCQELETSLANKEQENQAQLRKINILFDDQAKNYQTIDFNDLYSLLQQIAERERANKSWWQRK